MGTSSGGKKSQTTINTPNFGTVKLGKDATQQLALADWQNTQNQTTIDKQTEANRTNQVTPWGAVDWSKDADGEWTQTTTLSPEEQAALDSQNRIKAGLSGTAEGMLGGIGDTYSKPLDYSQFSDAGKVVSAPGADQYSRYESSPEFAKVGAGPSWQELASMGNVAPGSSAAGSGAGAGMASVERAKEYDLLKQLDMSNMPDMPVANEDVRNQVSDALYKQFQSRLDPQWKQREDQNLDRLYAMGARETDPLYDLQTGNLSRERNDAYNQADWQSIVGGGQEMERLFNMGLGARKQGWEEALGQGTFTNKAFMDQFQQGAFNAGEANETGRSNAANQTQASIASARNATDASIANAGNSTSANIASAGNRMRGAEVGLDYGLRSTDQNNRWDQNAWENSGKISDQDNAILRSVYGDQRTESADLTADRNRQISEAISQRQMPLNELMALLTGQQVNNPLFSGGPSTTAGAADTADYYGAFTDNQARSDAKKASNQAMLSSGIGAASSLFAMSDRRLKSNIVQIGKTPAGYGVYSYEIFGKPAIGVMADEVPAEWTALHPSGYMMVDYARVR